MKPQEMMTQPLHGVNQSDRRGYWSELHDVSSLLLHVTSTIRFMEARIIGQNAEKSGSGSEDPRQRRTKSARFR
jgi:hypothetical protein